MDSRNVFVIHGRNEAARLATFQFLRSIGLQPLEWSQIVHATGKGSPYVGEVIDKGFEIAQAAVAVMTPDDVAKLRKPYHGAEEPEYETELTAQPRQNVLFESGIAMGKYEARTILVQLGDLRPMSDILGRHVIRMDNSIAKRQALVQRLKTAGCAVDDRGTDWHNEGDFEACIPDGLNADYDANSSFIDYLDGLSDTELYWLVQAVAKREQTIHGYINDMTPRALASKGFIELVGSETTHKMRPNLYTILHNVWKYLTEHEVPLLEQAIAKNQGHNLRLENLTKWLQVAKERETRRSFSQPSGSP